MKISRYVIRYFLRSLVLIVVLLLITVVLWLVERRGWSKKLQVELASLKARNVVVDLQELQAGYKTPNPDATGLYLEAFSVLTIPQITSPALVQLYKPGYPMKFPASDAKAAVELAELEKLNVEFLQKVREANKIMASRYPVDFSQGLASNMKHCADVVNSAKTLRALGWYQLRQGRHEEAVAHVFHILRLGRSLEAEPFLISQLMRAHCLHQAVSLFGEVLSSGQVDAVTLDALKPLVDSYDARSMMAISIAGERCVMADILTGSIEKKWEVINFSNEADDKEKFYGRLGLRKFEMQGLHMRDLLTSFQVFDELDAAAKEERMLSQLDAITDRVIDLKILKPNHTPAIIPGMLLPSLIKGIHAFLEAEVAQQNFLTAIAIERYHLTEKRFPESLEHLIPKYISRLPVDSFSSGSLIYVPQPAGYFLYSVGKDGEDDRGAYFGGNRDAKYDIVFSVVKK